MRNWLRDESGAALIVFTIFLVILIPLVGGVIDYSVALLLRERLRKATDAAVLAVALKASAAQHTWQTPKDIALAWARANLPPNTRFKIDRLSISNGRVDLTLAATSPNRFLGVVGISSFPVKVRAVAAARSRVEVALVLDNSRSMEFGGKMLALQNAAFRLIDILVDATPSHPPRAQIAVVPFSSAVNVGTNNRHANWLSFPDTEADATEADAWQGCVFARENGDDTTDASAPPWRPYLPPPPPKCAREEYGCPRPIVPLTANKTDLRFAVIGMQPIRGTTVIPQGLVWGWRALSPYTPFNEGASYSNNLIRKYIVVMTDGENILGSATEYDQVKYCSAYGAPGETNLEDNPRGKLNAITLDVCRNIRRVHESYGSDNDIAIIAITFGDSVAEYARDLMRECATSGPTCPLDSCYFHAPSNEALIGAFTRFANAIKKVALVR